METDILITGFLVGNDQVSNWFRPLTITKPISQRMKPFGTVLMISLALWSCSTQHHFIAWRGTASIRFLVKGILGCGRYASANTVNAKWGVNFEGPAHTACNFNVFFMEDFWKISMPGYCFFLIPHTVPHRISSVLVCFWPSSLLGCPVFYCFHPLQQLPDCCHESGIEGDLRLADFDPKTLKKTHCCLK